MTIPIGTYGHWPFTRTLSLTPKQAARHWHVLGTTGAGKSTFLKKLCRDILRAGMSFTLLDPAGDLAQDVLELLAADGFFRQPEAFTKLRYLDIPGAAREEFYMPFNVLNTYPPGDPQYQKPDVIADNILTAMHRAWPELDSASAMFDVVIDSGIKTLLVNQLRITSLHQVINDKVYREQLLAQVTDPNVLSFWHNQFDRLSPKDQADQAGSASRRAYQLTRFDVLRYSLGQDDQVINFREFLDTNTSSIVKMNVEGEGLSQLLGSLLLVQAVQGAMSRASIARGSRFGTHFLIIDEFEKFVGKSSGAFADMLSQTRKYGLFLIAAHQDWDQAKTLMGALQNAGIDMAFRLGALDAPLSALMLGRVLPKSVSEDLGAGERETVNVNDQDRDFAQDLMDLPDGYAYIRKDLKQLPFGLKHVFKRRKSQLYRVKTAYLQPPPVETAWIEARYREMYFRPRAAIEATLQARRGVQTSIRPRPPRRAA